MCKNDYSLVKKLLDLITLDDILSELEVSTFDVLLLLIEEGVVSMEDLTKVERML